MVKRAHMVSKGYLRAWADARGVVELLDIQDGRGIEISVVNATVVNRVYDADVLTYDLEGEYAKIEDRGIPVIKKLCDGIAVTIEECIQLVAFLEMHRYRGRYADRAGVPIRGAKAKIDGTFEDVELTNGDLLLLSRAHDPSQNLTTMGLETWAWRVWDVDDIPTGDGAVMLWQKKEKGGPVSTVSFPLSPTRLLMIGDELPKDLPFKGLLAEKCRRWIVGTRGSLNLSQAAVIADLRAKEALGREEIPPRPH